MAKLDADLKEISSQDSLMAHLVDELLLFDQELRLLLSVSPEASASDVLTVLSVLLDTVAFDKWRNLEKARM